MTISLKAIDRIFARLTATYGRMFTDIYIGVDIHAVKSAWMAELDGFGTENGLNAIAWALENLPDHAPNAIQFKKLVRQAPEHIKPRLPEPKADPERLKAELAKLGEIIHSGPLQRPGKLDWAKRIVAKFNAGDRVAMGTLAIAKAALAEENQPGEAQ